MQIHDRQLPIGGAGRHMMGLPIAFHQCGAGENGALRMRCVAIEGLVLRDQDGFRWLVKPLDDVVVISRHIPNFQCGGYLL